MARAQAQDFLHNFRFTVRANGDFLQPAGGFTSVTIPDFNVDIAEYREGTDIYTKKQAGIPTFTDVTLTKGKVRKDTKFFDWVRKSGTTTDEYRTDVEIQHFHRDDRVTPASTYRLNNAWAFRVKVAGDLDSTSSDISITEMDVAFESLSVT
jgi:phage tail-like protein